MANTGEGDGTSGSTVNNHKREKGRHMIVDHIRTQIHDSNFHNTVKMEVDEELSIPLSSLPQSCGEDQRTIPFEPVLFPETESESASTVPDWRRDKCITDIMKYALERDEDTFKDVTFLVGPDQEPISAHRSYLGLVSPMFAYAFFKHQTLKDERRHLNLLLPDTSPNSFRLLLRYVYVRRVEVDMDEALEVLKLAYRFKISDLVVKCASQLRLGLNSSNAAEILQVACSLPEPRLRAWAIAQIASNPKAVFQTPGFLSLDLDSLCAVLDSNLNLDEVSIFLEVKRWAEHSIRKKNLSENVKITGEDIRKELGKALFLIRFPLLTGPEFCQHVAKAEILRLEEAYKVLETMVPGYDHNSSAAGLPFSSEPRMRKVIVPTATIRCTGVRWSENEKMKMIKGGSDQERPTHQVDEDGKCPSKRSRFISMDGDVAETPMTGPHVIIADPAPSTNRRGDRKVGHTLRGPHKKEQSQSASSDKHSSSKLTKMLLRKSKNLNMLTEEEENYIKKNMDSETGNNLTNLYESLKFIHEMQDSQQIQIIREDYPAIVINTAIPMNLELPCLTDFHVNFLSNSQTIQSYKTYVSTLNIIPLLLFRKFETIQDLMELYYMPDRLEGEQDEVNVTIVLNGVTILKADFREDSLILSRIDTSIQWIMEGVYKSNELFPRLRSIHLEECVTSLKLLPHQSLESITLREVRGLRNFAAFLQKCKNLREFSCTNLRSETIDFGVHLGLFSSEGTKLRRIALRHAKIQCSTPVKPLNNHIEELYLTKCQISPSFIQGLHFIFPNLKKLKIVTHNPVDLILNALKIDSLEWLCVWEQNWNSAMPNKTRRSWKNPNDPAILELVKIFQDVGFDAPWIHLTDKAFILFRRGRNHQSQHVHSSPIDLSHTPKSGRIMEPVQSSSKAAFVADPLGMTRRWMGIKIQNKLEQFRMFDYEQFGWAMFYKDYALFEKLNNEWE